jgi:thiaminase/transcriptional activator TenA
MSFSAELREAAEPIWQAQHDHPFVRGIGDGSVAPSRFARWVRQDYLFLIEYCRVLGFATARAPDLATLRRFADLLQATAVTEMDLHRVFAAELGVTPAELEQEQAADVTRAYADFLVRTASAADFAELAAALLPCMWGYSEIGIRLAERGRPSEPRCAAWIDAYAAPEFSELAAWCRDLVDRLGADVSPASRARMRTAFEVSSRYELAFWDA